MKANDVCSHKRLFLKHREKETCPLYPECSKHIMTSSIKAYGEVFNVCAVNKMSHLESKLAIVVRPKLYALLSEEKQQQ